MNQHSANDQQLLSELKQTLLSLREQLDQCHRQKHKENERQLEQHLAEEQALKQTISDLREQLEFKQVECLELKEQHKHLAKNFDAEKQNMDQHFQQHMHNIRTTFEDEIQRLKQSSKKQLHLKQQEINELQGMVKNLRQQLQQTS